MPVLLRVVGRRLRVVPDHLLADKRGVGVRCYQIRSTLQLANPMPVVLETGSHSRERETRFL